ncbi:pantoate--beta-alanine ligase [Rhizoctonia solani AG-1 IB]|uniref:Pantoate--beta-alanine ligase n=1 Tax=Thanatephorus cucumeris (strain AG1-IB / isolate 7/3/14) TaxID=1108050 RepID=M5C2N4_THACB|nr:pantoate--beta-alanine ligase [Rhizoctonia solani AG-1 IB]CEL56708.1 pantoate--beta-alanine ligase [Rhizoctonia solani AG-1 IB]
MRSLSTTSRSLASALPGYPTPGTAFSPPPAPSPTPGVASAAASTSTGSTTTTTAPAKPEAVLPKSDIPIITTVADLREWRNKAFREGKSVGFVPTMGALHDGHISLVRDSLRENDLTVVSIYVNPAQFAPHEDLATYPRTLENDSLLLSTCSYLPSTPNATLRSPSAIFLPSTKEMYPSGLSHATQLSTYVVPPPSLTNQMEGLSRPTFFRGVATVVSKLLNITLPTRVYFGQKDIQQALLMKSMVKELCFPTRVRVIETIRGEKGLALSSRNAYLQGKEKDVAGTLRGALKAVEKAWYAGMSRSEALATGKRYVDEVVQANAGQVEMKLDYIEMNDPHTFEPLGEDVNSGAATGKGPGVILSGALWVGRTRLIDNVLLGEVGWVYE